MFEKLKEWRLERKIEEIPYSHIELVGYLTEEITEGIRDKSENQSVDWRCDCIVFLINSLEQDGYDAEKCMDETIKEISSRTGAYNPETKKWEKFKTKEAMALWYKANYSKCKKENYE